MSAAMTNGHHRGGVTERPRYYARQLITPAELNLEAAYFVERLRRHNRLLHGWGVVCGALVCRVEVQGGGAEPWKVRITPGHLIDPDGNEVAIATERVFDLRTGSLTVGPADPPGELSDPWCSEVWTPPERNQGWVAVRYRQSMARPVRVQPAGCSCDDSSCEYSRWCDGYELRLLDYCPTSHQGEPPTLDDLVAPRPIPACPDPPPDPWVVLAKVEFDDGGNITAVDNCGCRRMVVSLAEAWWKCTTSQLTVTGVQGDPAGDYSRGQQGIKLKVTGTAIDQDATADLGPGVKVTSKQYTNPTTIEFTVRILKSAQKGERDLTITNPDCRIATLPKAIKIV
jgi:Quinohemoprotein amine dehydrogenase, alpha subunit domain III